MNTKEFKQIIGEVVREELKTILPQVLDEYFSGLNVNKKTTDEDIGADYSDLVHTGKIYKEPVDETKNEQKKEIKRYTGNEVLNQILNETKALPREGDMVVGGSYETTNSSGTFVAPSEKMLSDVPQNETTTLLKKTFTKDYSKLMKAIDKKKLNGSGNSGLVGTM